MDAIEKIRTVIVENDKESLFLLQEHYFNIIESTPRSGF